MNNLIRRMKESMLFRLILVMALLTAAFYFSIQQSWIWSGIMIILLLYACWWLLRLHQMQIRKVIFLLDAIENNDNALRFTEKEGTKHDQLINKMLNRISQILYEAKSETIQQEKYYELILNSINTGVIVLNDKGAIYQRNNEALRLLGLEVFTHIRQLYKIDPDLIPIFENLKADDKAQIQFVNERGQVQLSIRVSDINIRQEHLRILALNDINKELDEKEIDSWIRLIRVLTHEIMNSVTPITSLSETLLSHSDVTEEEVQRGLQTISTTGKGLLSFVDSYRKFTRIPTPEPCLFDLGPFIERMIELARHQHNCDNITFQSAITPPDLILYADEHLISQVIINLLKNAVQAIGSQPTGLINIRAYTNEAEEVIIEISNNGPPIPAEIAEQIFIPFFTTKDGGNGIGLSLSRQIMRLSGGSINMLPVQQSSSTTFILSFR
ncbi:MAG: ATP-binding protein [Bacteroides sp.]|nr:ATP-binding protein [Bacteroides sp.]